MDWILNFRYFTGGNQTIWDASNPTASRMTNFFQSRRFSRLHAGHPAIRNVYVLYWFGSCIAQIQFNEFLLRIPEINYVASVRLEPLGALAVLQLDLALAPPIIDLLLGGEGRDGALRELTDIEESILASVVEIICRELTAAWQPVGLSFNFERRQMQTQVARIMSVTEKTLCLSFEIRMPHSSGLLNLAFPAVVANTILRQLAKGLGEK